ncbi:flagellar hook-associated protein 2 [Halalkalibacter alkalisediminis]|uniref:Flagellar hook-associated protein 2 n=1 Tax=Halalkalibacter alkalisediminis TaxID=935616 RepID=A0ABV6NGP9_9BACI|nr:flagellar hook-associated protein 2 [Halalkalibacter alkalisediminis]
MRIGGLASGIDTESIIKQFMQVERQPLDRFFQRKQTVEWQRDAYRDMNLKLRTLEESAASIRLRSSLNTRVAKSSNEQAFTVSANADVQNGTYHFKVDQVATKSRNISAANITTGDTKFSASTRLDAQANAAGDLSAYNGTQFSVKTYDSAGAAKEVTVTIDTTKSLNENLKQINDSDIGVRAYYDSAFDRVVIERKETGEFNGELDANGVNRQIVFGGNTSFLNDVLHIHQENEVAGVNAKVEFQNPLFAGETITQESRANRITIGGLTFNVTQPTNGVFETVNVSSNTDDAFDKIKAFVDTYNDMIAEIQTKLTEPKHRDFPPLTDEQRQELSEREAELWDEKAKSGLLRRDPMLSSVLTQMRNDIYTPVSTSGQFNQIAQVGITTTRNFRDGGRLEIDEAKLRAALEDDPDSVHQLFNNVADKTLTDMKPEDRTAEQRAEIQSQTGIIGRLRTTINDTISKVVRRAGNENRTNQQFTLGRELINVDSQIDRFQRRLAQIEQRYWSQFTRMETAVNQANAQGNAMMSQLFGGM